MIYPLLFLLSLASLSEGCAPHSPKRRPRPQPPVTESPPVTPKTCSSLPVDTSCTDCSPETNSQKEIKCPATGKNQLVIVDSANTKKPVTEAKCDSATGKWAFKNENDAVSIEPAKVYCSMEFEVAGNCVKACPPLTTDVKSCETTLGTISWYCGEPAKNDLEEVTCAGENDAIVVVDAADKFERLTEAKCDPATGTWAFKKAGSEVTIEATKVFCSKICVVEKSCSVMPCPQLAQATAECPALFKTDAANCGDAPINDQKKIQCPYSRWQDLVVLGAADTDFKLIYEAACDEVSGQWYPIGSKIKTKLAFVPTRAVCGNSCDFAGPEFDNC